MTNRKNPVSKSLDEKLPEGFVAKRDAKTGITSIAPAGRDPVEIPGDLLPIVSEALRNLLPKGAKGLRMDQTVSVSLPSMKKTAQLPVSALPALAAMLAAMADTGESGASKHSSAPVDAKPERASAKPARKKRTLRVVEYAGETPPAWYEALNDQYQIEGGDGGDAVLKKVRLAVEEGRPRSVLGVDDGKAQFSMWGFEISTKSGHVGWVVAESENSFVITGVPNYTNSVHRVIEGVITRLTVTVLPNYAAAA